MLLPVRAPAAVLTLALTLTLTLPLALALTLALALALTLALTRNPTPRCACCSSACVAYRSDCCRGPADTRLSALRLPGRRLAPDRRVGATESVRERGEAVSVCALSLQAVRASLPPRPLLPRPLPPNRSIAPATSTHYPSTSVAHEPALRCGRYVLRSKGCRGGRASLANALV